MSIALITFRHFEPAVEPVVGLLFGISCALFR